MTAFLKVPERAFRKSRELIGRLEDIIQRDEGNRGIGTLFRKGELFGAAKSLLHCKHVLIVTGFPCLLDFNPPTETDGPLGAVAIARSMIALGKKVTLLTDECNEEVLLACAAAVGVKGTRLQLESFPGRGQGFDENDLLRLQKLVKYSDGIVAIERAGPSQDGTCRTMRMRDMTEIVAPLELIFNPDFIQESKLYEFDDDEYDEVSHEVVTIGIGDGGNEVGMGKIYNEVVACSTIPHADTIACVTSADHIIVSSVSNWGGYALASAVSVLAYEDQTSDSPSKSLVLTPQHFSSHEELAGGDFETYENMVMAGRVEGEVNPDAVLFGDVPLASGSVSSSAANSSVTDITLRSYIDKCLPSGDDEVRICSAIIAAGARDGITKECALWVDGMPLEKSLEILFELRDTVYEYS